MRDDLRALDDRVGEMDQVIKRLAENNEDRLLGISKRGDVYLRTLMIHGARAVVTRAKHRDDRLSRWVTGIATRRYPSDWELTRG